MYHHVHLASLHLCHHACTTAHYFFISGPRSSPSTTPSHFGITSCWKPGDYSLHHTCPAPIRHAGDRHLYCSTSNQLSVSPVIPSSGLVLLPAAEPFPHKLVDKVKSGQFVEMREPLADNISLVNQREAIPGYPLRHLLGAHDLDYVK